MGVWKKGDYLELMEEAEAIWKRLCQQSNDETEGITERKKRKKWRKEMFTRQQDYCNPNKKEDCFQLTKRLQRNKKKKKKWELGLH